MRIGVISDIHANLPALEAVFAHADGMETPEAWICLGDIVGYYAQPNEVIELIQERHALCLRGNHDAYFTRALPYDNRRENLYRVNWTREQLNASNARWLASLPTRIDVGPFRSSSTTWACRHANLTDEETYLYPDTPLPVPELNGMRLLVGHSHHPMDRQNDAIRVINPGSVGQPRNWLPGAFYGVLDTATEVFEHHRVGYDVHAYADALRNAHFDEAGVGLLTRTRPPR